MALSRAFFIAAQIACYGLITVGNAVDLKRQTSNSALFHHRAWQSSIIIGDYLYIDGGEITTWNGSGTGVQGNQTAELEGGIITLPDNNTYSIDLSSVWNNGSATINPIRKSAPVLNSFALWADADNKTFYAYDGGVSQALPPSELPSPPGNALWQFTPSGNSGSWSDVGLQPESNFTQLVRTQEGSYASGNGLGFALSGSETWRTTTTEPIGSWIPTPGVVIYNTTSQSWLNVSTSGYSFTGSASDGAAWFVPSFGAAGVLVALGGKQAVENTNYNTFNSTAVFDLASQQWLYQTTSGTSPAPCVNPCIVGAQGDNGTYEIFFFGGAAQDIDDTLSNGAVHVLSFPSFNWQKQAATPTTGRWMHSCNVVAGTRQMVVVGGRVSNAAVSAFYGYVPDPWDNGLGVFDLSAMEWQDLFNPKAAAYVTPDVVKAHYQANGKYPDTWGSSTLEGWFTMKGLNSSTNSTTPSSSPSPAQPPIPSHHSRTGAIVGSVIGGVIGLLLIAVVAFFCLRRRRGPPRHVQSEQPPFDYEKAELDNSNQTSRDPGHQNLGQPTSELCANDVRATTPANELGGQQIYEMPNPRP